MKTRRLFIDPASRDTGWAVFEGKKYIDSGTVQSHEKDVFIRLRNIFYGYEDIPQGLNVFEVHIENIPPERNIARAYRMRPLLYSVGAIGAILVEQGCTVHVDLHIKSWQKHVDWKGDQKLLKKYKKFAKSEDELAAIGMGLWYTSEKLNEKT